MKHFTSDCVSFYLGISGIIKAILSSIFSKNSISKFEQAFAKYLGVKYALALQSGRCGLYLSLKYIKENRHFESPPEVLLCSYNFFAVPEVVLACGFKPVFIDADILTANLCIEKVKSSITENTAALILTHTFGNPADIGDLKDFLADKDIALIEDSAHALGSSIRDKKCGAIGFSAFFSLSLTKIITSFQGGVLVTNDDHFYKFIIQERKAYLPPSKFLLFKQIAFGLVVNIFTSPFLFDKFTYYPWFFVHKFFGKLAKKITEEDSAAIDLQALHVKLSVLQAELAYRQIPYIDNIVLKRQKNSNILRNRLATIQNIGLLENILTANDQNFVVISEHRDKMIAELLNIGIVARPSYLNNCALQKTGMYENSEKLDKTLLFLPNHSKYSQMAIISMCAQMEKYIK